jgi:excisionase family DNA binding protein
MASPPPRGPVRSASAPNFAPGERFLTVGIVAEYFGVTEVTIKNWVDAGQLLAARTVGGHRRIAASSVAKLLEEQGRPVPAGLARRKPLIVLLDGDANWTKNVRRMLSARARVEVESDPFAGLLLVARLQPDVVVIDVNLQHGDGKRMAAALRNDSQTKPIDVIAIGATPADGKNVATLVSSGARGSGSLAYYRRGDHDAIVEAVMQRADRPQPPPRPRRR